MASEEDLSLFESTIDSSSNIGSKQGRGIAAQETWIYTRKAKDGEPEMVNKTRILYCKHCTKTSYGVKSTTSFQHHLLKKHDISVSVQKGPIHRTTLQQLDQLYQKAEANNQTSDHDTYVLQKFLNKDLINEALISLITVRNLPF